MTNRITGKLIPKDNRYVTMYVDFFPDGDIGGDKSNKQHDFPDIPDNYNITEPGIYNFGNIGKNITITSENGDYTLKFNYLSGNIALPDNIIWQGGLGPSFEVGRHYEINVDEFNYGLIAVW